ncbi:hypothetical protein TGMAS_413400 [Toxoplasma gondii MAS]|uniref:Uncharacterized protein n=1 Tax=Toxoplasma gondii MAS TaxID=943118 RepID=A0A086QUY7_TOXGO|nr:hypothetical protein TGMAS_413400 [Toxoplasma gondii MAS]
MNSSSCSAGCASGKKALSATGTPGAGLHAEPPAAVRRAAATFRTAAASPLNGWKSEARERPVKAATSRFALAVPPTRTTGENVRRSHTRRDVDEGGAAARGSGGGRRHPEEGRDEQEGGREGDEGGDEGDAIVGDEKRTKTRSRERGEKSKGKGGRSHEGREEARRGRRRTSEGRKDRAEQEEERQRRGEKAKKRNRGSRGNEDRKKEKKGTEERSLLPPTPLREIRSSRSHGGALRTSPVARSSTEGGARQKETKARGTRRGVEEEEKRKRWSRHSTAPGASTQRQLVSHDSNWRRSRFREEKTTERATLCYSLSSARAAFLVAVSCASGRDTSGEKAVPPKKKDEF